jgi:hypothetical protein
MRSAVTTQATAAAPSRNTAVTRSSVARPNLVSFGGLSY